MTEIEFSSYWTLLCEAKNRTPSAALTRMYALIIKSEGITAQQWAKACTAAIRFERFMPTPQQLVDLAHGHDFKGLALAAWDLAMAAALRNERADGLDADARRLLNSATNGESLSMINLDQLPWLKKEFVERYTQHLADQAANCTPSLLDTPRLELTRAAE